MALIVYELLFANFVPSEDWYRIGNGLAIAAAVGAAAAMYWGYATGRMRTQEGASLFNKVLMYTLLPFMLYAMFWMIIVHALPDLVTLAVGDPHEEPASLIRDEYHGRRGCRYRVEGEALRRKFLSHVCIGEMFFAELPDRPVALVLKGKATWFGFHVSHVARDTTSP
ncbi:hypothetical protein N789_05855 [Arenimonas oryziterrae DSM 21050 = YC6267]|uniref:Uncharacterized protein n=2 Tax=Arenimonas TaxID=490567 RepID=A0A091AQX7_9GAMM|nr:hypothetical protein N789_05855 [Arenimonas oryziterrae DSM 21050 = YC6267]